MQSIAWLRGFLSIGIAICQEGAWPPCSQKGGRHKVNYDDDDGLCRPLQRIPWRTYQDWPYSGGRPALFDGVETSKDTLRKIGERLKKETLALPEVSPKCEQKLRTFGDNFHRLNRYLPRHPRAEVMCTKEDMDQEKDGSLFKWKPKLEPLIDHSTGRRKKYGTMAFSIGLAPYDDPAQVHRLLSHLFEPGHVFLVRIDSTPYTKNADVLAEMIEKLAKEKKVWDRFLLLRHTDIVYPGLSMVDGDIYSWWLLLRNKVAEPGFQWDYYINLSGSDYPLMSPRCMGKRLSDIGIVSHIETFIQTPTFCRGHTLRDVVVECLDDTCREADKKDPRPPRKFNLVPNCTGFIHYLHQAGKPPLMGSVEFGGSYWALFHHDFINYTLACLDAEDPSGIYYSETYCASVRGQYDYWATQIMPEELFYGTALLNGPQCTAFRKGNLRWTNWQEKAFFSRTSTSYPQVLSPGVIGGKMAQNLAGQLKGGLMKNRGGQPYLALTARKLSLKEKPEAYDILDGVIANHKCD